MTLSDVGLLGKKIVIGILVTVIPFLILFGGLWFAQKLLSEKKTPPATTEAKP